MFINVSTERFILEKRRDFKALRLRAGMANYDLVGNIAIVKFKRGVKMTAKLRFAKKLLREHKNVHTVVEKTGKFKGRLRKQVTRHLAGEKTKEALYKENGCAFRFSVDTCYFSPRLAAERQEVAEQIRGGERVLVMFGGVAPFAIVIAKAGRAANVVSVELSRECTKYAMENVKRNKLGDKVEVVQGDVRKILPKLRGKFDRIVMARPNLKDSFLDAALPVAKKGGMIYYYGFCTEDEIEKMKEMIHASVRKARREIDIVRVKKAGDIGVRTWRWRVDMRVLN